MASVSGFQGWWRRATMPSVGRMPDLIDGLSAPLRDLCVKRAGTPEKLLSTMGPAFKDAKVVGSLICGATNDAHLVRSSGRNLVLRIPSKDSHILHSSLGHETRNTCQLSEARLAPKVEYHDPATGVMLLKYIDGHTLAPRDLMLRGGLEKCTRMLKNMHKLPPFKNSFDVSRLIRHYGDWIDKISDLPQHKRHSALVERTLQLQEKMGAFSDPRPCHNDPMAKNFMREGKTGRLYLIDFEFSGNGDPTFDHATLFIDSKPRPETLRPGKTAPQLPGPEVLTRIATAYQVPDELQEAFKARILVNAMAVDVVWGLYSHLQANLVQHRERLFTRGYRARLDRAAYLNDTIDLDLSAEKAKGYS